MPGVCLPGLYCIPTEMLSNILFFMLFMLVIASFLRDDFVFTLVYLLSGVIILSQLWSRKALASLQVERKFEPHAFPGERVPVELHLSNAGRLPILWLRVAETTPVDLKVMRDVQQVVSLPAKSSTQVHYELEARRRGYYRVGPLQIAGGDLLGILKAELKDELLSPLIVYPRVVALPHFRLNSRLPMGTLRDTHPLYEDPSRPVGKRDYLASDSMRRIDWKTSAATGRLKVKTFEPAIELQAAVFLNLNPREYDLHSRYHDTELAIVTAASIVNWANQQKQRFGFFTNGTDLLNPDAAPTRTLVKKGRSHLMNIFESMARLKPTEETEFVAFIHQQRVLLGWGATLVLITPHADDNLFDEIFRIRRAGHQVLLILCGLQTNYAEILPRCSHSSIPLRQVRDERDLERMM